MLLIPRLRPNRRDGTGPNVISPRHARRINALMMTCGHYDGSGAFAYRVGIPGKSGVGGGIQNAAGSATAVPWAKMAGFASEVDMQDINPITHQIADLRGRLKSLRGYL